MPVRMMHGPGGRFLTEEENASRPKVTRELLTRIGTHLVPYWKQLFLALLCDRLFDSEPVSRDPDRPDH